MFSNKCKNCLLVKMAGGPASNFNGYNALALPTKCTFSKLIIYHAFFLIYRNLSSWLIQKCVAAFTVLRHGWLVPFILKNMYFGVSCFFWHVLLYRIVALLLYSFSFIFLHWYICSAGWAVANFMFFVPCILI